MGGAAPAKPLVGRVMALPVGPNSYTECLYAALHERGIEHVSARWSGRWLLRNVRRGDTLHFHWPSFHYFAPRSRVKSLFGLARFVAITTLLKRRGVRIVWTAHNLYPHDGGRGRISHRLARRYLVRTADEIFVHGPRAAEIVRNEFGVPGDKLTVIPHGHWIGVYPNTVERASARAQLGIPDGAFVYAFVGVCKPYKGLEQLLDAVERDADEGTYLMIAGKFQSDAYREWIDYRVREVGPERVGIHPGYIEHERMQLFLNAADAVVLPYRDILTSGAAMLAMSFGRPVVAPRLGALGDFVDEECGVLYDPDAPGALVEAMREARTRLFDSEEILRRVSRFTWDEAARPLERLARGD